MGGESRNESGSGAPDQQGTASPGEPRRGGAAREAQVDAQRRWEWELGELGIGIGALLDEVEDTVFLTSPATGKPVHWNRAFREVSGYNDEEIAALKAPDDWYGPEDLERVAAYIGRVVQGGAGTVEVDLITKDGSKIPFEYSATPFFDPDGALRYLFVIGRDMTERRRAEAVLRESERRYRELYTKTPMMLHSIDPEGRLLSVSDRWLQRLGYSLEEVLGHRSTEFLTEESRRFAQREILPAFFKTGVCKDVPYRFVAKGGEVVDVLLSAISERDARGEVTRSMAVLVDVTERTRVEAEKQQLEAQLLQAQKMEAVGRLAGGVAHDFNNLLTAISANVELAELDLDAQDPLFDTVREIGVAAERAANLTRQLLAFSRKQIMQPRVVDLNELLRQIHRMLGRIIGEDIVLETRTETAVGRIRADPGQVEQLVVNLVVNARDAMPRGGRITIETADVTLDDTYCRAHHGVVPGDYVLLLVADTGEGMSAEVRDRAFEPFFSTKEMGRGTGLGLSTVYGIVTQHQGHIAVDSEPGQGATFRAYFPRVQEAAVPLEHREMPTGLPRGTETLMVVEDDATVRHVAVRTLRKLGYEVLDADRGSAALRLAASHPGPIHLVVTDVIMPVMNGRELADELRKVRPETRILFTSGYTDEVLMEHGVLEEELAFLSKPYSLSALAAMIRQILERTD